VPDLERRITVALNADTAFDNVAEPARLPDWVPWVTLEQAIAVDGNPELQDQGEALPTAPPAGFQVDRHARRVNWSSPSGEYAATLEIQPMMAGMSSLTIRVQAPETAASGELAQALDALVRTLQRRLVRD
jgi:hypothetical protein